MVMNIIDKMTGIFREVFDDDAIEIKDSTTATDIDGWDSLSHVNLIIAIEERFKIKFGTKELLTFKNVGDLRKAIEGKVS
jgi:acyl carrier protein